MTTSAELVDAVCATVRDQPGDLAELIDTAVRSLAPLATADERTRLGHAAFAQMAGLGALDHLVG